VSEDIHRATWNEKRVFGEIYTPWYQEVRMDLNASGKTLELGSGSGNFKEFKPDVISSDREECDWLDMCFDAYEMPFGDGKISNIVMIDVLHHLSNPVKFFDEVDRVLRGGGRVILIEPFPTFGSLLAYRLFHPEPFDFNIDYFSLAEVKKKEPWESNQAISYLLFLKHRRNIDNRLKNRLWIKKRQRMSCVLYPLSGGFEHKALIPDCMIGFFRLIEILCVPLRLLMAFRFYVSIEKCSADEAKK